MTFTGYSRLKQKEVLKVCEYFSINIFYEYLYSFVWNELANVYYKIRNDEKMAMIVETRQSINKAIAQE